LILSPDYRAQRLSSNFFLIPDRKDNVKEKTMGNNRMNRRDFLGKSAFGLFSAGFALPFMGKNPVHMNRLNESKIIYRTLGRTKLKIPVVSFGVMNSDNPDLLLKAMDMGINHLDTANVYLRGNSERMIGKTLEETGRRKDVSIATKVYLARDREKGIFTTQAKAGDPGATAENLYKSLDTSLQRLRTDYVDILYLHSLYSPKMATFEPLMNALVKVKKEGKARFIGVSTHQSEPDVIRTSVDSGIYDVILTAYSFMMKHKDDVKKAIQYAADNDVGIVAMKTQGGNQAEEDENIQVNHKAALKWVLSDKNVCTSIPGMTTFEQVDLNFSTMSDLTLTESEKRDLHLTSLLPGALYCQNCRTCISSCPQKVEIPNLMRAYMYAEGYKNLSQAQDTAVKLPEDRGLKVCSICSSCTASCRYGKNIPRRINALIDMKFDLA
jgi:predicted aldo/keto reductase-like oxidoreductase